MKVFVHVDAFGTYVGNGGFLTSCNLANRLAEMGYDVSVFDSWDRLESKLFKWLSLKTCNFNIANTKEIHHSNPKEYRIITSWLQALPMNLRNKNLRVWDRSELLRVNKEKERKWVLQNCDKIAVAHRHMLPYYNDIGIHNPIILETWIRNDACYDRAKIPNTVGIQLEQKHSKLSRLISIFSPGLAFMLNNDFRRYRALKGYNIILCNGPYAQTIERMKKADFFVHNPKPSPYLAIFKGETFGLPLFDAMACGCVCIAVGHRGIDFLRGTIPLVQNMNEAKGFLEMLMDHENLKEKEKIRNQSVEYINKNYRFDEERKKAIKQLLE